MISRILIVACFAIAAIALFVNLSLSEKPDKKPIEQPQPIVVENPLSDNDHAEIENIISTALGVDADNYAVYIYRPDTELTPVIFNSHKMKPASMIKIFVMAKAMQDAKEGKFSLEEKLVIEPENIVGGAGSIAAYGDYAEVSAREAIELMIEESDNTATNMIIDRLGGIEAINEYLKAHGYNDTEMQHKMMLGESLGLSNYSSAKDIGTLFTKIYNHKCVDDHYDQIMIDYLLKQEDTECLPTALPYWNIAHKTGEVFSTYIEGGICYGPKDDFIIAMMINDFYDRAEVIEKMQTIAKAVSKLA